MDEQLWGPKELAHYLGVSERTASRLMQHGQVPAFRVGRKLWRVKPEDVRSSLPPPRELAAGHE